jgi:hypothetical protein
LNKYIYFWVAYAVMMTMAMVGGVNAFSQSQVHSLDSSPSRTSYEEWIKRFWQEHISVPSAEHPYNGGTLCPIANIENVSIITHSIQGHSSLTCSIPQGFSVLVPIMTGECDTDEAGTDDEQTIRKCATEGQKYGVFEVTLDGKKIENLEREYIETSFFPLTIPPDNVYQADAGTFKAMAAGYFAFLKPLQVGQHEMVVKASVINPEDPSLNFSYDAVLGLNVE